MSTRNPTRPAEGVETRHSKRCAARMRGRCNCQPTYQANVWDNRSRTRVRKSFATLSAARQWRRDALTALERGAMVAVSPVTLTETAEAWLEGVKSGAIRSRKGTTYKPSAVRGYERALRLRVLPELGHLRLGEVSRRDVQRLVDNLLASGLSPSTVVNTLNPLQAIYRRALQREEVSTNPTERLELPRQDSRRERIASPEEAARLLEALPAEDRAVWATAMYAGLRRGELRALRVSDVDLATGLIRVERAWDDREGEIEGKTRAARRTVPIAAVLRDVLVEHLMTTARTGEALMFGTAATRPFEPSTLRRRALAAWEAAGLASIGLHECRHTFASLMIASGVNAKALCSYMGHATVAITFDTYGKLMPGNEEEAAGRLDAYLARGASRDNGATTEHESVRSSAVESGSNSPV